MKKTIITSVLYTLITAVILGIGYPLLITGIDHVLFPKQSSGELITHNGEVIGSHLIGQTFTGDTWFNSRPSAAGTGYDATSSSGSNLGSTSKALIDRVQASTAADHNGAAPVPVDLVTASGSGLDPTSPPPRPTTRSRASPAPATSPSPPSPTSSTTTPPSASSASSANPTSTSSI